MSENGKHRIQDIAIIGMALRFPGAKNSDEFWHNLVAGKESITFFEDEELLVAGIDRFMLNNPSYVKASSILDDIDLFDASFFHYTPREAELIDPQNRLFLECAWEALENSGYVPGDYNGLIGVYGGAFVPTYLFKNMIHLVHESMVSKDELYVLHQCISDFLTTNVSYKLNLTGPSVSVQTWCTTSLTAVHLACQSLRSGECDIALAGGVNIRIPQEGYFYQEGGTESPDGHSRSFDVEGRGTVPGNGVGIVVLKKLEAAIAGRDFIYAVIKGSCINNDGSGAQKLSYNGLTIDGQYKAISKALMDARVDAETINYVEAHGGATELGDRLELAALSKAYRTYTEKKIYCAIGSVKPNIGHLGSASGIASLIKTTLALKNKMIPASINFEKLNSKIDLENSPFYVNNKLTEWKGNGAPRRAGVNSYGIGGTNAHIILEEAPSSQISGESRPWQLLVLSAKTNSALDSTTGNLTRYLKRHSDISLADVAFTLSRGRRAFDYRRMLVSRNLNDAVSALEVIESNRVEERSNANTRDAVVFMFPGQASQYVNMTLELYHQEPSFRKEIDHCAEIIKKKFGFDLHRALYPPNVKTDKAVLNLNQNTIAGPALVVVEYALAKVLIEWGVNPKAMIGYSLGEYTAACLAGVFSIEDALTLIAEQAKLVEQMPPGSMLAVSLSEEDVTPFLGKELSLAAVNGPEVCIVSGTVKAIEDLQMNLETQHIDCLLLNSSHAFHSKMMEPVLEQITEMVRKIKINPPQIPFISTVTGNWITEEDIKDRNYWAQILRQTVRFEQGLQKLLKKPEYTLLEVGPRQTLCQLVKQHPSKMSEQLVLSSLPPAEVRKSDMEHLLTTLGHLWLHGVEIDWSGFYNYEKRYCIPLPTYPFERKRYWINPLEQKMETDKRKEFVEKSSPTEMYERPDLPTEYSPPTTEIEKTIVNMWQVLFGIDQVGIHDNFFNLGGNSLLGTMFLNKLRNMYKSIEISLRNIFNSPTIAEMSKFVEESYNYNMEKNDDRIDRKYVLKVSPEKQKIIVMGYLQGKISQLLNIEIEQISLNGNLEGLDLESITTELIWDINKDFQILLYSHEILSDPSIESLTQLIISELNRMSGLKIKGGQKDNDNFTMYSWIPDVNLSLINLSKKNKRMIFIVSAGRSGSTLLRIMLGGHTRLFCPPELGLLLFNSIGEWHRVFASSPVAQDGLVYAFMEVMNIKFDDAKSFVYDLIKKDLPIHEVYQIMQTKIDNRILVDKSPQYTYKDNLLMKAEKIFEEPKYIYLVRHPYAVIESFVRNRFDKAEKRENDMDPFLMGEYFWTIPNRNLTKFFKMIDESRYFLVHFEDMVSEPRKIMKKVFNFLELPFEETVLCPYDGKRKIVGPGGDPNIFMHDNIDPGLGEKWRSIILPMLLSQESQTLASHFNYELPIENSKIGEKDLFSKKKNKTTQNHDYEKQLKNLGKLSDKEVDSLLATFIKEKENEKSD